MEKKDADLLVSQMRNIMLNKKVNMELRCESEEMQQLQDAIFYLADCMSEFQEFLMKLCAGELDIETPGKQNFLSGYLKELHSILKHLTWQTVQVAEGDYNQQMNFLGEFSVSFNKMVKQLEEREISLREKSEALSCSMNLLVSVMDKQQEWILVADMESDEIVYANKRARQRFYNPDQNKFVNAQYEVFFQALLKNKGVNEYKCEYECNQELVEQILFAKGYSIRWEEKEAYAFFISDITEEKKEKRQLKNMAYEDELTSVYNRRYCLERLEALLWKKKAFSLAVIDIDGLKHVNDTFGHIMGDEYVQRVARHIESVARSTDAVCRIGGDEFIVIWPNCHKEIAQKKMEEALHHIRSYVGAYDASVSYGVVYVEEESNLGIEAILEAADEIMYAMKQEHHANDKGRY